MPAFLPLGNSPGRDKICADIKSLLLAAFPAKDLETHFRAGYTFRSDACTTAFAYDPDYCIMPGDVKMDPQGFGPERTAGVGMIQSAFNCSPVGETLEVLRQIAIDTLHNNLWRAIEAELVAELVAFPTIVPSGAAESAICALADAAQFLATNGNCGQGIIVGPYSWFVELGTHNVIWNGTYHTDLVGNIVIPLSTPGNTVYAFDSNVDIRVTEVMVLDERAPALTSVNDRIVRAEQIFTVAIDPCVVGAFDVLACSAGGSGGGGGGGGGGSVTVTNFPASQTVNGTVAISNLCSCTQDVNILSQAAPLDVNVVTPPPTPLILQAEAKLLAATDSWTPGDVTGTLTSVTFSILTGTATMTDSNGTILAGLPAGLTMEWDAQDENSLTGPQSITADAASSVVVNWTQK